MQNVIDDSCVKLKIHTHDHIKNTQSPPHPNYTKAMDEKKVRRKDGREYMMWKDRGREEEIIRRRRKKKKKKKKKKKR